MPTRSVRIRFSRWTVAVLCLSLLAACSSKPRRTVPVPVYSERDTTEAIRDGALAMADCSREQVRARLERRPADLAPARGRLAGAVDRLRPIRLDPSKPQYEQAAAALESALAGIDRVLASIGTGYEAAEALGWGQFERAVEALMLALAR